MNLEILIAGSLGALAVFLLGTAREWRRDERERRGLLRLLLAEIEHNAEVVRTVRERRPALIGSLDLPSMKTEVWRDSRPETARDNGPERPSLPHEGPLGPIGPFSADEARGTRALADTI